MSQKSEPPIASPELCQERLKPAFVFVEKKTPRDSLAALHALAEDAETGELLGFAYTAMYRNREYSAKATGEMDRNPTFAIGTLVVLISELLRNPSK